MIDVKAVIDGSPMGRYQFSVVILCAFGALLDGFDIQAMAFAAPAIADEWELSRSAFGPALAASLGGLLIGTIAFGTLGDRLGRRPVLIGGLLAMGLFSLFSAASDSMATLIAFRIGTGLAIGACLPNMTALTAEIVPSRRLDRSVVVMFSAVPLGGVIGGYVASDLISAFGWRSIFVTGGALPIILSILFWIFLPESPQYLVKSGAQKSAIGKTLERISENYIYKETDIFWAPSKEKNSGLAALFVRERFFSTSCIWGLFFLSLFVLYTIQSWLPLMLRDRGWSIESALRSAAIFQLAGISGGIIGSWLSERLGRTMILTCLFLLSAVFIFAMGWLSGLRGAFTILVALTGFVVIGGQQCMLALTAAYYPPDTRATGIGWGLGVGRLGAVIGPLLAGLAMSKGYSQSFLFTAVAFAPCLCCLLVLRLQSLK